MDDAKIESRYTSLLENIFENATFLVKIHDDLKTNANKVRQGDKFH